MNGTRPTFSGTRAPAVAGTFYPADPTELRRVVTKLLDSVPSGEGSRTAPKGLIVPHAGYVYSGPIAATAYAQLRPFGHQIRRVVLLGPAHRHFFHGLAASSSDRFATPLGTVPVDVATLEQVLAFPGVQIVDAAHAREHSLEVQLPFLQQVLREFTLVPLLVGASNLDEVAGVIEPVWDGPETCLIISSDLSHGLDDRRAQEVDSCTAHWIEQKDFAQLTSDRACGYLPIQGVLRCAHSRHCRVRNLDLRNSSQTAGTRDRVVGYGAWVISPTEEPANLSNNERSTNRFAPDEPQHAGGEERPVGGQVIAKSDRQTLLRVAGDAIRRELQSGLPLVLDPDDYSHSLRELRATFVTLKRQGELRGCVGGTQPSDPLVESVARSAGHAAFRDRRFSPLTAEELDDLNLSISVLSEVEWLEPTPSAAQLAMSLRPFHHGLLLRAGTRQGVFLPSVWEILPDPGEFIERLMKKAGWDSETWPAEARIGRFTVEVISGTFPGPGLEVHGN